MVAEFHTIHNLPFEAAPWEADPSFTRFRIGTCHGLWRSTDDSYDILAVANNEPGNGHFEDVLQWFYFSCKRDNKCLRILETWNENLKKHLINKRGFLDIGKDNVELPLNKMP